MKTHAWPHNSSLTRPAVLLAALLAATMPEADAALVTLFGTPSGDAQYGWNSKYGPYGYTEGGTTIGVGLYFGAPYGNDYTMGIVEIPISGIRGGTLTSANLNVYSEGFGTGYFYGSAGMRWLDVGAVVPTGNPVTDGLGPMLGGPSNEYVLWDSSVGQGAGWFSFDVTAHVQADLDAGRDYSTFVLNGSRDTGGGIRTAEYGSGFGPQIDAVSSIPEPASITLIGSALGVLCIRRRRPTAKVQITKPARNSF